MIIVRIGECLRSLSASSCKLDYSLFTQTHDLLLMFFSRQYRIFISGSPEVFCDA